MTRPVVINRTSIASGELRYLPALIAELPSVPYSDDDWRTLICAAATWALPMELDGSAVIRTPHEYTGDAALSALIRYHTPEQVIEQGLPCMFAAVQLSPEHQGGVRRMLLARLIRVDVRDALQRFHTFVRSDGRGDTMPAAVAMLDDLVSGGMFDPLEGSSGARAMARVGRVLADEFEARRSVIRSSHVVRGMVAIAQCIASIGEAHGTLRREPQRRFVAATKMLLASRDVACGDCAEAIVARGVDARCEDDTPFVPITRAIVLADPSGVVRCSNVRARWDSDGRVALEGEIDEAVSRFSADLEEVLEDESHRPEGYEMEFTTFVGAWTVTLGAVVASDAEQPNGA